MVPNSAQKLSQWYSCAPSHSPQIITRMSVDAALPLRFVAFASQLLVAPAQIAVSLYLVYRYVGVSTFAGLALMVVATPLSGMLMGSLFKWRRKALAHADERVKLTNDILTGIRVIKFYAWEVPMAK